MSQSATVDTYPARCERPAPMGPGTTEADVVIVGSALAGLIAGAILTRHGKRAAM